MRQNNHTTSGDAIISIREQALKDTAASVKSMRRQNDAEPNNENVINALKSSQESMFFLACHAGNDDEEKTREILNRFGLGDIR